MKKGGYQIVDFKGTALTSGTAATIAGVYDSIKNARNKMTVVSGLKVGTLALSDAPVLFTPSSTSYVGILYYKGGHYTFAVTNASSVTVTDVPDTD